MVGHTLGGAEMRLSCLVLAKVQVVNDMVEDHPYLITINLLAPPNEAFSIFDAN